jgi:hypothetical protein
VQVGEDPGYQHHWEGKVRKGSRVSPLGTWGHICCHMPGSVSGLFAVVFVTHADF